MKFSSAAKVKLTVLSTAVLFVYECIYMQLFKMGDFYGRELSHFVPGAGTPAYMPHLPAMFGFYVVVAIAYVCFVYPQAAAHKSVQDKFMAGAFFGLILGAAMNLCNFAFLGGLWPMSMLIADTLWSSAVGGLLTVTTLNLAKRFKIA